MSTTSSDEQKADFISGIATPISDEIVSETGSDPADQNTSKVAVNLATLTALPLSPIPPAGSKSSSTPATPPVTNASLFTNPPTTLPFSTLSSPKTSPSTPSTSFVLTTKPTPTTPPASTVSPPPSPPSTASDPSTSSTTDTIASLLTRISILETCVSSLAANSNIEKDRVDDLKNSTERLDTFTKDDWSKIDTLEKTSLTLSDKLAVLSDASIDETVKLATLEDSIKSLDDQFLATMPRIRNISDHVSPLLDRVNAALERAMMQWEEGQKVLAQAKREKEYISLKLHEDHEILKDLFNKEKERTEGREAEREVERLKGGSNFWIIFAFLSIGVFVGRMLFDAVFVNGVVEG